MQLCFIYKFVTLVEKYRNSVSFTFTPGFKQFSGGTNRRFVLFTLVKFKLFCKIERKLYVRIKNVFTLCYKN
jgi:hypothetical protein